MPSLNMAMIITQIHPDVQSLLKRVNVAGGSIRAPVVSALNEFVKYCYKNGLRDKTGANHTITLCSLLCANTSSGANELLWYPSGLATAMTIGGTVTYAEATGYTVKNTGGYLDTKYAGNNFSSQSVSIFIHNLTNTGIIDYFGCDDTASGGSDAFRLSISPKWTDNICYFDVGNTTTGSTGGRVSATNTNSAGLNLGIKNGANQYVYKSGTLLTSGTTATSGLTMPTDTFTATYAASASATTRNVAGFGAGKAIATSAVAGFTTAWNAVQTVMSRANS